MKFEKMHFRISSETFLYVFKNYMYGFIYNATASLHLIVISWNDTDILLFNSRYNHLAEILPKPVKQHSLTSSIVTVLSLFHTMATCRKNLSKDCCNSALYTHLRISHLVRLLSLVFLWIRIMIMCKELYPLNIFGNKSLIAQPFLI